MNRSTTFRVTTALLLASLASACTAASDPTLLSSSTDAIVGGVPAHSASLNAVGSINQRRESGAFTQSCTGTLIAPTVVLTAQHCIEDLTPADLRFAIGPDSRTPLRNIAVRSFVAETSIPDGGILGLGADVAVLHLAEPVTNIRPLRYARFDERRVGQRFSLLGYGIQNSVEQVEDPLFETRLTGSLTLRGPARGRILELTFGSVEAFLLAAPSLPDFPTDEAELREIFEQDVLLTDYEAVFGGVPGDAQQCFGDSGGPILKNVNGSLVVFGVSSGGPANDKQICGPAGVFAVLGPVVLDFLQRESGVAPL